MNLKYNDRLFAMKYIYTVLSILLLLCLAPMPYGYYMLVRFVAMTVFAVSAYHYYDKGQHTFSIVFGALALLFQPFIKIALGRFMWNIVDVLVALWLLFLLLMEKRIMKDD